MKKTPFSLLLLSVLLPAVVAAQADSLRAKRPSEFPAKDAMTLLIYTRSISDARHNLRFDQNVVANFKIIKALRMEAGYRHGERTNDINAYDHYKIELQTKLLTDHTRLIMRMSDNVVRYQSPNFSRSNYLIVVENKLPISERWEAIANLGYVVTFQRNNVHEVVPETSGSQTNHFIYKAGLKYKIAKGALEGVMGTYDVFNPYLLNQAFFQIGFDYELWNNAGLYSYFRYQYDDRVTTPFNNFVGLGIKFTL